MDENRKSLDGAEPLYRAAQVRARDQAAIGLGLPSYTLMTRAAAGALDRLRAHWPRARRLLVLCGGGNNGGDGLVLARLAAACGLSSRVMLVVEGTRLQGDAARAWRDLQGSEVAVHEGAASVEVRDADVVVDALFGTGLSRPIEGHLAELIGAVNASGRPVLALDVPSGICSDTGAVLGCALRAAVTVTFVERKVGHYLGAAADYVGSVYLERLGIEAVLPHEPDDPLARLLAPSLLARAKIPRDPSAHKGRHGHVLIVGGAAGMAGAARLAGEAALYAGAGLVTVATAPAHAAVLNLGRPELMCHGVAGPEALGALLARASVVVAGPGLGQAPWGRALLGRLLEHDLPLLLDADGLNLLAEERDLREQLLRRRQSSPTVLTPHPGEAGRLLGWETSRVQADRLGALSALTEGLGATVVLKGAGSLIGAPGWLPHLCDRGNPGMAVAGMGDVLSGVIGALLAQGVGAQALESACMGVLAHATAGDLAVRRLGGQRGLLAGELAPLVRECLNTPGVSDD